MFTYIHNGPNVGKYRSAEGKIYTKEQIEVFYAKKGDFRKRKSTKSIKS